MLNQFAVFSLDCCDFPSSTCLQNEFSSPLCRVSCVVALICNKMLKGSLLPSFNMVCRYIPTAEIALLRNSLLFVVVCFVSTVSSLLQGEEEFNLLHPPKGRVQRRHMRTIREVRTVVTRVITDIYYINGAEVERKVVEVSSCFCG